ncbi:MAG TPA: hypothetical protein VF337_06945 [Candidatus Limnocylindrales bacterium]
MSNSQEAPALIQYACERCKTRFVLPPSSRTLSIAGKFRAFSMGVSRALKFHEGLGAGYDTSRRQLLAKMDDEAYQSFVQSFRFCHECRQFVCNECWSTSRRSCLTCVAKSMTGTVRPRAPFAPTGPEIPRPVVSSLNPPRKGRKRRDVALVGVALMIIIVSLEAGILITGAIPSGVANATAPEETIYTAFPPTSSPSAVPTETAVPTDTPFVVITDAPTASPSPIASATSKATPTRAPVVTLRPTTPPATPTPPPAATPTPVPDIATVIIACNETNPLATYTLHCSITSPTLAGDGMSWMLTQVLQAGGGTSHDFTNLTYGQTYEIMVYVTRLGVSTANSQNKYWTQAAP